MDGTYGCEGSSIHPPAHSAASEVGRERLINISVAAAGGTDMLGLGGTGVIVVWYWGV